MEKFEIELRIRFLNENYVMLGELEDTCGKHSKSKTKVQIDRLMRSTLNEIKQLKEKLKTINDVERLNLIAKIDR